MKLGTMNNIFSTNFSMLAYLPTWSPAHIYGRSRFDIITESLAQVLYSTP